MGAVNREDVDRFLAESHDVIEDWHGGPDSAQWHADGSHEEAEVRGHYGDIRPASRRSPWASDVANCTCRTWPERGCDVHPIRHRRDPAREAERRRLHDHYQTDEAEWLASMFPPPEDLVRGNLWPRPTADAFPGRYHTALSTVDRTRLWRYVLATPDRVARFFIPQRTGYSDLQPGEGWLQVHTARLVRFGGVGGHWPVVVDDMGRCCGPVLLDIIERPF